MRTSNVSRAGVEVLTQFEGKPSVLVRDLIAASIFEANPQFEYLSPEISVILPTFRRGDNGMLRACIDSVLAQTFENFELIIIDDGSTDSTRSIIEESLSNDPRVATIRHPKNIGLPAVSSNEAILRSRSPRLFFTFDDNTLEVDALETMIAASASRPDIHFFYAEVFCPFPGDDMIIGSGELSLSALYEQNLIANGAVLLDRVVLDRCGMYDPHLVITRLCDWDLWIRVAQEFELHHVNKVIAIENGRTQSDSLGNSHPWDLALVREWMATDRNHQLRPDFILDYNVAVIPNEITGLSKSKIQSFVERFFLPTESGQDAEAGYVLLICDKLTEDLHDVFFQTQRDSRVVAITYFQIQVLGLWDLIVAARAVIFTGSIAKAEVVATRLRLAQKTYGYYLAGDPQNATTDAIFREFLRGTSRFIWRSEGQPVKVAEAESIVDIGGLTSGDLPEVLERSDWRVASLPQLLGAEPASDIIEVLAMMNRLMQSAPPLAIVPAGYYTPRELAARVSDQLRHQPLSLFRFIGAGLRAVTSRGS